MNRLRHYRKLLGITATDLGKEVGLACRTINNYENGGNCKDLSKKQAILKVLQKRLPRLKYEDVWVVGDNYELFDNKKPSLKKATAICSNLGDKDGHTKKTTDLVSVKDIELSSSDTVKNSKITTDKDINLKVIKKINDLLLNPDFMSKFNQYGIDDETVNTVGIMFTSYLLARI